MKTSKLFVYGAIASSLLIISCQKNLKESTFPVKEEQTSISARQENPTPSTSFSVPYIVELVSHDQVGNNWEWVWSVKNSNPGNGKRGTVQDLSHWGINLGDGNCNYSSEIVGAAYSSNGTNWTTFNPTIKIDPSQSCMTSPVLKFDFGTTGSSKSFYKLIVSNENAAGNVSAYYKSGTNTGCGIFGIESIVCGSVR